MPLVFPTNPSASQTYQSGSSGVFVYNGEAWDSQNANLSVLVPSASFALTSVTASLATAVSTSISNQNASHNVLFVDTVGLGNIQVDGGLRYNPNTDSLTTTSSFAITSSVAISSSFATSASQAISSSFARTAVTSSTNTLAYAALGISAIPAASNSDMTPTLLNGTGITVGGNTITIANPGVYLMNASIGIRATFAEYAWVDASNNKLTGTNTGLSVSANSTDPAAAVNAMGIVNITSPNTVIKLRIFVGAAFLTQNTAYAVATITQLR
jgi:hypothetical protein